LTKNNQDIFYMYNITRIDCQLDTEAHTLEQFGVPGFKIDLLRRKRNIPNTQLQGLTRVVKSLKLSTTYWDTSWKV
jgi:hypothetical protein